MVLYNCLRCTYSTDRKDNLRKHYNNKKTCEPVKNNTPIEECLETLENAEVIEPKIIKPVIINDYDNTNYDIISESDWLSCIENNNLNIVRCFEIIHLNKKYPENHNIKIENSSNRRVMILRNNEYIEIGRGNKSINNIIFDKINKIKLLKKVDTTTVTNLETYELFRLLYNKIIV